LTHRVKRVFISVLAQKNSSDHRERAQNKLLKATKKMANEIDYEKNASFWREATSKAKKSLDYVAGQNPFIPEEAHRKFREDQMNFFFSRVVPHLTQETDVLDVGCGPGTWAMQFAPSVRSVHGIDIAPAFVEHAKAEAIKQNIKNATFEVGSFLDFQTEKRFGLIVLGAMLVYVNDSDLVPFFKKLRGWLAPGGFIYARTGVAPRSSYVRRGKYQGIYRTLPQYESAMRAAGFNVETERDYTYTDASLAAVYFGAANIASLGLIKRIPGASEKIYQVLESRRSIAFDGARSLLDKTPLPICYHFLLRDNG
jgi:2-polyprenyl-3-methyl-5-hydroxy-6-metoxy-1,4-benzoquinol methylase